MKWPMKIRKKVNVIVNVAVQLLAFNIFRMLHKLWNRN